VSVPAIDHQVTASERPRLMPRRSRSPAGKGVGNGVSAEERVEDHHALRVAQRELSAQCRCENGQPGGRRS
jgi:hypothetical protein